MVPSSRPVVGFVLGLVGGVLILVGVVVLSGFTGLLGIVGLVFGILVLLGSVMLYAIPSQHVAWGVIVLVFSIASIVSFGGFIVGMVLGIVGGAVGIAWDPHRWGGAAPSYMPGYMPGPQPIGPGPYGVPVTPWRMCMGCGRWIPWAYNLCPLCGTAAPVASWVPKAWQAPTPSPAQTTGPPASAAIPSAPAAAPTATEAAPSPVAAPEPVKAPCPTCDGEAEWASAQRRWYCPKEARFF